jgi:hypothetical protein
MEQPGAQGPQAVLLGHTAFHERAQRFRAVQRFETAKQFVREIRQGIGGLSRFASLAGKRSLDGLVDV